MKFATKIPTLLNCYILRPVHKLCNASRGGWGEYFFIMIKKEHVKVSIRRNRKIYMVIR